MTVFDLDPVALSIPLGGITLNIRWYALAYVAGLLLGWMYARWHIKQGRFAISLTALDDFLLWALAGVVLGGRLGYVLFYRPDYYFDAPEEIFAVWRGGMSFHGGLIGVALAIALFAGRRKIPLLVLADLVAIAGPIGLFFGRLANFINRELVGRPTDLPWGVVFDPINPVPRHPSQLYEAVLEGLVLFVLLLILSLRREIRERAGFLSGVFLIGYALARFLVEFVRAPDDYLGFILGPFTMGQLLTLPMMAIGLYLLARAKPKGA